MTAPRLEVVMADPAEVTIETLGALREVCEATPGETRLTVRIGQEVRYTAYKVHVGPPFLKALRACAPSSWSWDVKQPPPPPAAKRKAAPPPPRGR